MAWNTSVDDSIRRDAVYEREKRKHDDIYITAWNPAKLDMGTYFSELIALLSVGVIITVCLDLLGAKNETEQVEASDRSPLS